MTDTVNISQNYNIPCQGLADMQIILADGESRLIKNLLSGKTRVIRNSLSNSSSSLQISSTMESSSILSSFETAKSSISSNINSNSNMSSSCKIFSDIVLKDKRIPLQNITNKISEVGIAPAVPAPVQLPYVWTNSYNNGYDEQYNIVPAQLDTYMSSLPSLPMPIQQPNVLYEQQTFLSNFPLMNVPQFQQPMINAEYANIIVDDHQQISIEKMHVKYITLQDEVLRDRIQEHINCVEGDMDALWDGEIYCVKHSSPYDLILKMWHELDIIESNSGETTTLKYYSFFLVHKACVLDGAFRSLKLQNAIGIERTSEAIDIEVQAQSLMIEYMPDILMYMYTGKIADDTSASALVPLYSIAKRFDINGDLAEDLYLRIKSDLFDAQHIIDILLQSKKLNIKHLTMDAMQMIVHNWECISLEKYMLMDVETISELQAISIAIHTSAVQDNNINGVSDLKDEKNGNRACSASKIIIKYIQAFENEEKDIRVKIIEELMELKTSIMWSYFAVNDCFIFLKICDSLFCNKKFAWRRKHLRAYQLLLNTIQREYQPNGFMHDINILKSLSIHTWTEILKHARNLGMNELKTAIEHYKQCNLNLLPLFFTPEYILDIREKFYAEKIPASTIIIDSPVINMQVLYSQIMHPKNSDGHKFSSVSKLWTDASALVKKANKAELVECMPGLAANTMAVLDFDSIAHSPMSITDGAVNDYGLKVNHVQPRFQRAQPPNYETVLKSSGKKEPERDLKDNFGVDGAVCVECHEYRHKFCFTKSQWRNRPRSFRRCKFCTGETGTDSKTVPMQKRVKNIVSNSNVNVHTRISARNLRSNTYYNDNSNGNYRGFNHAGGMYSGRSSFMNWSKN